MKLYAHDDIPVGRVRIWQRGGGFECELGALICEPGGEDSDTTMTVNPADVRTAMVRFFGAPSGSLQ